MIREKNELKIFKEKLLFNSKFKKIIKIRLIIV